MARSIQPFTWKNGFREPGEGKPWETSATDEAHYTVPPSIEILTSTVHNSLGLNALRTWPTIYDGTANPHGLPDWWRPEKEVDVLICGAGPSGLEVALSLARQGVTFRIIDKAATPLIAGRADGVQPRFLETLHSWGLATEVHEEGPLIERTAIYKDGKKILFGRSHQSDSRYRGLHIITQGQIERIYIRDLLRHKKLVERETIVTDFLVESEKEETYPVQVCLKNEKTGTEETVRAKFLVGSDGASSTIRKKLGIPFDGVSTDIYWGIMDCIFESDYPHAWVFGSVISSEHGGCVIIPREDGYIRLYTQLDTSETGEIAKGRQAKSESFLESGGRVDVHSITPEEVLEQANRIFAPYKLKFAAPLSWFAVWKISERVARSFSSPDSRVHLVGDAAHVHSVMGAFGLNASIMDACNLAWKLGMCAQGCANLSLLGPTYNTERRLHANCIIRVSGSYLRFVCNSEFPLAEFERPDGALSRVPDAVKYTPGEDLSFLRTFFSANGPFLLGVDAPYAPSILVPTTHSSAIAPLNGVRAPNPRLCFSTATTGYLYDALLGAAIFHIVVFASDVQGPVRTALASLSAALASHTGFYARFGGKERFNVVLIAKAVPHEIDTLLLGDDLKAVRENAQILCDDRAPDEDAHTCYEVSHSRGAVVVIRPDLWVGTSAFLGDAAEALAAYFGGWMMPQKMNGVNGHKIHGKVNGVTK